jgi:hypothetical protein
MIGLCEAVQETVRTLFGEPLIAELTEEDVKAAVAGDRTRTGAWEEASDRLLVALKSGELTGFAVQAARQIRVPLPARYWSEWIGVLPPADPLRDHPLPKAEPTGVDRGREC